DAAECEPLLERLANVASSWRSCVEEMNVEMTPAELTLLGRYGSTFVKRSGIAEESEEGRKRVLGQLEHLLRIGDMELQTFLNFFDDDQMVLKRLVEGPQLRHLDKWLAKGTNAEALLQAKLSPFTVSRHAKKSRPHASSWRNTKYTKDPLYMEVDKTQTASEKMEVLDLVRAFDEAEKPCFPPPDLIAHVFAQEGDV
ncbi:hypothetical protein V5O48_019515, partial [Marasmius crinis-equi]